MTKYKPSRNIFKNTLRKFTTYLHTQNKLNKAKDLLPNLLYTSIDSYGIKTTRCILRLISHTDYDAMINIQYDGKKLDENKKEINCTYSMICLHKKGEFLSDFCSWKVDE